VIIKQDWILRNKKVHHIYTTSAFVINSSPYGEAGKFIMLFTRDFGMIGAVAQGIRLSKSKLKYHIQDYSFSKVSIVKGKEVWRLTGAGEIDNISKPNILHIKILKLLKRLLHGEEKNENLFEIIESLYKSDINNLDISLVEYLIVLRVLFVLGYIKKTQDIDRYLDNNHINQDIINDLSKDKQIIIKLINNGLHESQL
jgi:DNA repair protein RecO